MNSIVFSLFAAGSAALSNLFFRQNSQSAEKNEGANGYLVYYYAISFFLSFIFYPHIFFENLNWAMTGLGSCVGILNTSLMIFTLRALQKGPAGLTFAFQNTSAVFPGMILFLLFGEDYGFTYSYQQLIGILLVVYGLFIGAKNKSENETSSLNFHWLKYALACLLVQVLALTLIQMRCVIWDCYSVDAVPGLGSKDDVCFMIGQFGSAFLIQTIYLIYQQMMTKKREAFFGSLGGITNFFSTFLLLLATKWALPFEKALLFPCFAVGTIVLCNIWANRIYGEKFHLLSNAACTCGILMSLM